MSARKINASVCKAAEAFVRQAGRWVSAKELCTFLGANVETVGTALSYAVAHGVIDRRHRQGGMGGSKLEWCLRAVKEEAPPKIFSIDWPPAFVSRFDAVRLPAYETRVK